jgi:hypothetical protein
MTEGKDLIANWQRETTYKCYFNWVANINLTQGGFYLLTVLNYFNLKWKEILIKLVFLQMLNKGLFRVQYDTIAAFW